MLLGLEDQDGPDGGAGPVFTVLAARPRVRDQVRARRLALHAGVQSHVLGAVHPRQHFPGDGTLPAEWLQRN